MPRRAGSSTPNGFPKQNRGTRFFRAAFSPPTRRMPAFTARISCRRFCDPTPKLTKAALEQAALAFKNDTTPASSEFPVSRQLQFVARVRAIVAQNPTIVAAFFSTT